MKKVLLFLLFFMPLVSNAQVYYYRTTAFCMKIYSGGYWSDWSDWEPSDIKVKIDTDNDQIIVYSPAVQVYDIIKYVKTYEDNGGGQQMEFVVIDQDYDKGNVRLRMAPDGTPQLYIDFADIMWAYNLKQYR